MQRKAFLTLTLFALAAGAAFGQRPRVSPHETVTAMVGGKKVTIEYGRPYLKGRKAVGGQLVPFGQVWRTGADEATKLTTEADLMIGTLAVPAGSYALFTLPEEKGWTLIVNKTAKQWGAFNYDAAVDLGRTAMKITALSAPVEQFTIEVTGSAITMRWENTEASVPVKLK
ncbi:MAG TPA: hypothetical protein DEH78_07775 [Solibacterales bacterium]|nr:hypothetical protein [Bryobacterales bacterium]